MNSLIALTLLIAASSALSPPDITGTTPPAIDCPNSLCNGRGDGNYEIGNEPNYFVQCVQGLAYCQACWPLHLTFSGRCNQCLYNRNDDCVTTVEWLPATTFECPDECPQRGPAFSGNIVDPSNPRQYVACWEGITVGCIACPSNLEFNEQWNACLYEGRYKTAPSTSGQGTGIIPTTHSYYDNHSEQTESTYAPPNGYYDHYY